MDQQNNLPGANLNASQYDFIMNPERPKKNLFNGKQRTLLIITGGIILVIFVIIIAMSILGGGDDIKTSYAKLQKQQAEIIRLSNAGSSKIKDYNTSKFIVITSLTIQSDQNTYASFFKSKNIKISKKEAAPTVEEKSAKAKSDSLLSAAESSGNYDETLSKLIKTQLDAYQKTLASIYKQSQNTKTKDLVKASNNNITLLLGQSN